MYRAVTKSQGPGTFPNYYEHELWLLLKWNKGDIEPKELILAYCTTPLLLIAYTQQLEIIAKTLYVIT